MFTSLESVLGSSRRIYCTLGGRAVTMPMVDRVPSYELAGLVTWFVATFQVMYEQIW